MLVATAQGTEGGVGQSNSRHCIGLAAKSMLGAMIPSSGKRALSAIFASAPMQHVAEIKDSPLQSAGQDTTRCYHLLLRLLKDGAQSVRVQASITFAKAAETLHRRQHQDETTLSMIKTLLTGKDPRSLGRQLSAPVYKGGLDRTCDLM